MTICVVPVPASTRSTSDDDDSDSLYNERPVVLPRPRLTLDTALNTMDYNGDDIDSCLDAEDERNRITRRENRTESILIPSSEKSQSSSDPNSPPPIRPPRVTPAASNGLDEDNDDDQLLQLERVETLVDDPDSIINNGEVLPEAEDELPPPMVEVSLTPTPQTRHAHVENRIYGLTEDANDADNDRFDSDEHVDVESLSTSDDDYDGIDAKPARLPSSSAILPGEGIDSISTDCPSPNQSMPVLPATKRTQPPKISLLSRASQTFYKTFIGRKTSSSDKRTTSDAVTGHASNVSLSHSNDHSPSHRGDSSVASVTNVNVTDDRYERLCRLLDAQLSALAGAKTGFVQLSLLRPLAEQTLQAVSIDARSLLGEFGKLEAHAERRRREASDATSKGEQEIVHKEQMLIEAKVALAEACGDVERLRGELAAVKRALAEPVARSRRLRKHADVVKRETAACRDARSAVEGKLAERKRSLGREKAELSRLEKEIRDIEGDWA